MSLFSALVRAPLGPAANPGLSLNPAKAPWYFLGFQELLVHLHPLFAVVVVPLLGALALVALPYLGFPKDEPRGAWFLSDDGPQDGAARGRRRPRGDAAPRPRRRRRSSAPRELRPAERALADPRRSFPRRRSSPRASRASASLRSRLGATRLEAAQALFVFLAAGFAVLTATGIWFRGAGMRLVWPWNA